MALFDEIDDQQEDTFSEEQVTDQGFVAPQQNLLCLGCDTLEATLLKRFNADRLPHAMIFSGPVGVGKATFAFRLARFLLSQEPSGGMFAAEDIPAESFDIAPDHPTVRRVSSGGHADLMVVGRVYDEKKGSFSNDIPVDEVRKITPFLRKTSSEGGWRVVIVDEAQHLNRSSQNALLKILEEPPKKAVLILITDQAGRFLPTIRSRCQIYDFKTLPDNIMHELAMKALPNASDQERNTLLGLSPGQIGRVVEMQKNGGAEVYNDLIGMLQKLPKMDQVTAYELSETLGRDKNTFPLFMELLLSWVSKMARATVRGQLPDAVSSAEADVISRLNKIYTPQDWLDRYDALNKILSDTSRIHLDTKQAVLDIVWTLEKE